MTIILYNDCADILRKYNPGLIGFATGNGKETSSNAKNNCAVSGATSEYVYSAFVEALGQLLRERERERGGTRGLGEAV